MPHQSLSGALTTQSKRDPAGHAENDNRKTHGSHRATGIAQHTSDLVAIRTVGLIALARIGIDSSPAITRTVRAVAGTTFGPSGNRNRIGFGDIRIRLERYGNLRRISGSGEIVIERELVGGKRLIEFGERLVGVLIAIDFPRIRPRPCPGSPWMASPEFRSF